VVEEDTLERRVGEVGRAIDPERAVEAGERVVDGREDGEREAGGGIRGSGRVSGTVAPPSASTGPASVAAARSDVRPA